MTDTALILGHGACARKVASDLLGRGVDVVRITDGDRTGDSSAGLTRPDDGELVALQGTVGNFHATVRRGAGVTRYPVSAVVVAEADEPLTAAERYGLRLSPAVRPLTEVAVDDPPAEVLQGVRSAVFLCGLGGESWPHVTRRVMEAACALQTRHSVQTFVLTGNLKVAGDGLEALYRKAKTAGTLFFKFDTVTPRIEQDGDGRVCFEFDDPVLGRPCRLAPDLCVVDVTVRPSPRLARLAKVLDLPMGPDGFLQTDNVHRETVFTLRKGVLAAGPARCVQSPEEQLADARNAALAVYGLLRNPSSGGLATAVIDTGSCIRCLTCFRLCPHRAVTLGVRFAVAADACEGCGICAAECPRRAIRIEGLGREEVAAAVDEARREEAPVRITAFCCSRSAAQAARMAVCAGYRLAPGLAVVEVPCAGSLSLEHVLDALRRGSDGVLVLTCHVDNCHSERGNRLCRERIDHLLEVLPAVGFDRRRLVRATLAANMGREFADITSQLETDLASIVTRQGA